MSKNEPDYEITRKLAEFVSGFLSECGRWQSVANRSDCHAARAGRMVRFRLPELGPLARQDWPRLTGRGPGCEERSGTCDKSGFATVAILDGAMPTTAQRHSLSRTKGRLSQGG